MVGHPPVDGEGGQVSSIFRRTRIYIGLLICRLQLEEDHSTIFIEDDRLRHIEDGLKTVVRRLPITWVVYPCPEDGRWKKQSAVDNAPARALPR